MKLTLGEVVAAHNALQKLDLPAPIAFRLAQVIRPLISEFTTYEEQRLRLVRKYGQQKGDRIAIEPGDENWGTFVTEIQALLDLEVEVEVQPLELDILKGLSISPISLLPIWFLFKETPQTDSRQDLNTNIP